MNCCLYIVDDGSPDGTADVARELSGEYDDRIEVISRSGSWDLGRLIPLDSQALLRKEIDYVWCRWTPTCHTRLKDPHMLAKLDRFDVAVGSSTPARGGLDPDMECEAQELSGYGNHLIRAVTGVRVRDVTSGFSRHTGPVRCDHSIYRESGASGSDSRPRLPTTASRTD